jgi:hypothetical protein
MRKVNFLWLGIIFLIICGLAAQSTEAASLSDLRRQLRDLENKLRQLEAQVRQVQAQIAQTNSEIAKQTAQRGSSSSNFHARPAATDVLGTVWKETEANIPGVWTRRGRSNTWDARWNNGSVAVLQISITNIRTNVYGEKVYDIRVFRKDSTGASPGFSAVYTGVLKSTHELLGRAPKNIEGIMVFNWPKMGWVNKTQKWSATISEW